MEIIKPGINLNIVGIRRWAYIFSLSLILLSIITLIVRGGPNYGIDFAGGILIQVKFNEPTKAQDIREGLKDVDIGTRHHSKVRR